MVHQVYTPKEDDEKIIQERLGFFKRLAEQEIIELIGVQKRMGIVDVHLQTLYLGAIYRRAREQNLEIKLSA